MISHKDFFCIKYLQVIKSLELYQKIGTIWSLFPYAGSTNFFFSSVYPHAGSRVLTYLSSFFIFIFFLQKGLFGLTWNWITFISRIFPTTFCIYIVPAFLKAKIRMRQTLCDGKINFSSMLAPFKCVSLGIATREDEILESIRHLRVERLNFQWCCSESENLTLARTHSLPA